MDGYYQQTPIQQPKKKKGKVVLIVLLLLIVVAAVAGGAYFAFGGTKDLDDYLDLGEKYLDEMDYDKALEAYQSAIEIDPMNPDAYLGIVEVYIRTEKYDLALAIAEKGYDVTGDERLKDKAEMIKSGNIYDSTGKVYKMTFKDANETVQGYLLYEYDLKHDGRLARVNHLNADEEVDQTIEIEYDDEENEIISYGFDAGDGSLTEYQNEYEDGKIVYSEETDLKNNHRTQREYIYSGDLCVKIIDTSISVDGNKTVSVNLNEYDGKGRLIKRTFCDSNENPKSYYMVSYNADGYKKEEIYYDIKGGDSILLYRMVYSYNEDGVNTGVVTYNPQGEVISTWDYN